MDSTAGAWRDSVHAAMPATDADLMSQVVRSATGRGMTRRERIVNGLKNEVYGVTLDSGGEVIVRVSRRPACRFAAERRALEAAREAGVPVPEVLHLDRYEDVHGSMWICVQQRVSGADLSASTANLEERVGEAGELLARLHTVEIEGFGLLDDEGCGTSPTWTLFLRAEVSEAALVHERAAVLEVPERWMRAAAEELQRHDDVFDRAQSRLLHGDLTPGHFLCDGSVVTGLIDFEDASGGDPAHDFRWWGYFEDFAPLEWLLAGYRRVGDLGADFELRRRLGRLLSHIDLVDYFGKVGNLSVGPAVLRHLSDDADWFGFKE